MTGHYDFILVIASYFVAVIASFSAIYFGTRVRKLSSGSSRSFWLSAGAFCLGAGIWSMHFVGMSAYKMPMNMTMSFDFSLTAMSFVAALAASGLALWVISREKVATYQLIASAVVTGMGIFTMHYTGMFAMKMQPAIQYDTLIVFVSGVIAVAASGAALLICRNIERVPENYSLWVKLAAALVMGIAICGMHYTGMAAISFPMDSMAASSNTLRGNWMGIPTAVASSVFLLLLLYIAYQDYQETERQKRVAREIQESATATAFSDIHTGLPNRTAMEDYINERLPKHATATTQPFALYYIELGDYRNISKKAGDKAAQQYAIEFAKSLQNCFPKDTYIARYNTNGFMLPLPCDTRLSADDTAKVITERLSQLVGNGENQSIRFGIGYSHYPTSGTLARLLIRQSQVIKIRKTQNTAAANAVAATA